MTEPSGDAKTPPAAQPPPPGEPSPQQGSRRFRSRAPTGSCSPSGCSRSTLLRLAREQPPSRVRVPYSPFFLDQVRAGHVKDITSKGTAIQGTFTQAGRKSGSGSRRRSFKTEIPAFADTNALSHLLQTQGRRRQRGAARHRRAVVAEPAARLRADDPLRRSCSFWLMRRAGNVQNVLGSFGRSRARRYQPSGDQVTFADVAGIDEAKAELTEVVDFLRNPDKYRKLGGRIPHGVLLSGPPGTGKTLLARAVAGEADVPFFSMSASEFVEAIVGVGASRVRDLFTQAKEAAPAIVFIDELDAIGRSRTSGVAGFSGGNDEREQTLNQILTEMDGFDSSTSVIVIAATNRPDVLDQALLRPGPLRPPRRRAAARPRGPRGDPRGAHARRAARRRRRPRPDRRDDAGHGRRRPREPRQRGGAARRRGASHDASSEADFTDALERIVLGAERQVMMTPEDRRRTAYHEGGHAIVGMLTEGADPVRKISIIPRGLALGVTFSAPETDRFNYQRAASCTRRSRSRSAAAPPRRSSSARRRTGRRVRHPAADRDRAPDGRPLGHERRDRPARRASRATARGRSFRASSEVSPDTQKLIDEEVRRIVDERARGGRRSSCSENREQARLARAGAARARDARRGRRLRRGRRRADGDASRRPLCRSGPITERRLAPSLHRFESRSRRLPTQPCADAGTPARPGLRRVRRRCGQQLGALAPARGLVGFRTTDVGPALVQI